MGLKTFEWAKYRLVKGAIKIHLLLDHDGYLPAYARLTDGKTHEVKMAHELTLPPGSIVVSYYDVCRYAHSCKYGINQNPFAVKLQSGINRYTRASFHYLFRLQT